MEKMVTNDLNQTKSGIVFQDDTTNLRVLSLLERFGNRLEFNIYSPGGNDTCLVEGIVEDPILRKEINDIVMKLYPQVEQVGFVDSKGAIPRLEMAGGEFCGNATRSFIYKYFNTGIGEGTFRISGVDRLLSGGVNSLGEAWSEMPIYESMDNITPYGNGNFIVDMEGISHYIFYVDENSLDKTGEDFASKLKERSMKLIEELGLDDKPAAGIIYVYKKGENLYIEPVVYVKSINTLFYETACGSGTTALGMVEALKRGGNIEDLNIFQPSGKAIKISVDYDSESKLFKGAVIKGFVESLFSGTVEKNNNIPFVIERVKSTSELNKSLSANGLTGLYQDIFSAPPYFERFTQKEVEDEFENYLKQGILFLARSESSIIGFGATIPLLNNQGVTDILKEPFLQKGWDIGKAWYMADLGVSEDFRGNGIGKLLVQKRLEEIPKGSVIIMRTSLDNEISWGIYKGLGFKELEGVYQDVSVERQTGEIKTDKRRFSYFIK